uniref:Uncharacterized protein n=1 Tax=Anguilla anguilla TaxID=7936 RepID=A0A0E9WQS6_ANGAN
MMIADVIMITSLCFLTGNCSSSGTREGVCAESQYFVQFFLFSHIFCKVQCLVH